VTDSAPDHCAAAKYHSPHPLRFVWHHIQPLAAGGADDRANTVPLCDSCHASVHVLLAQLAAGALTEPRPNAAQLAIARQGFALCEAAGTLGSIMEGD
jgi:HNH endonuclease